MNNNLNSNHNYKDDYNGVSAGLRVYTIERLLIGEIFSGVENGMKKIILYFNSLDFLDSDQTALGTTAYMLKENIKAKEYLAEELVTLYKLNRKEIEDWKKRNKIEESTREIKSKLQKIWIVIV